MPTLRDHRHVRTAPAADALQLMSKLIDVGSTIFKKRHPEVGARPGTLVIADDAPPPKMRDDQLRREEVHEQEIRNAEELSAAFDPGNVTWVDVQGFGDEPLIREIGEIFLDPPFGDGRRRQHATTSQGRNVRRPSLDHHADGADERRGRRRHGTGHASCLGENYVLTFQERYGDILDPVRQRIRTGKGRPIRRQRPGLSRLRHRGHDRRRLLSRDRGDGRPSGAARKRRDGESQPTTCCVS